MRVRQDGHRCRQVRLTFAPRALPGALALLSRSCTLPSRPPELLFKASNLLPRASELLSKAHFGLLHATEPHFRGALLRKPSFLASEVGLGSILFLLEPFCAAH